ncbi:hypothetical protein [Nonomuraea recticatena]|uniref:hypothetical protein n=1 Tax=Nonomuraea recticatena TaxID=46178 RepID=UPI00361B592D
MTNGAYLRYPHLHGDLITFVADDDVWLAPVDGGRAWRFTADRTPVSFPRFSPDGARLAWTSTREGAPEAFAAEIDGPEGERLTHWGNAVTGVRGWTTDGRVLAISPAGQPSRDRMWAYAVPLDGGQAERLPYGWVSEAAVNEGGGVVTVSAIWREPSQWKRYRGGTAAKIWIDADGSGSSPGCSPTAPRSTGRPCGSATGSPSWPTTRAPATSTPPCPTAPTCAGTPHTTASTPGTPPPTAPG